MAEVRMVWRKTYRILKPGYSHSFLDSVCKGGHRNARPQDALSGIATLKETDKIACSLARRSNVSSQSLLPTTTQEQHGTGPKIMSPCMNAYGSPVTWKQFDICVEHVGMCLAWKGKTLPCDRTATRTFCLRPHELNGVNIWSNIGRSATINPKIFRTRRDQIRTFCTMRYGTGRKGFTSSSVVRKGFSSNGFYDTPLFKSKSAYYEILQVASTATQAQIKTAYYKQSFIYHPDKNAGSEAASRRFSEITEAYNVLGNKSLRKKYDRGILTQTDLQGARRPSPKESGSGAGQQTKSRSSSVVGIDSKKVFDFDNFINSHYGEQLKRDRDFRTRQEEMQRKKEQGMQGKKLGGMSEVSVGILIAMAIALVLSVKSVK
ncbi:uncharacterized protein dnajc30a [Alosa pseudoharengus]|uniref:uncharacterized protein dnajc30a n=1 Tax=Alosa pseudoharengus TaxID=34774 RepID=UPI003F88FA4A